jgi:prepilin-type N-terminal cleavage/methylation domain-containing protein/prepilin-type processing-associated H-X9-DG protein
MAIEEPPGPEKCFSELPDNRKMKKNKSTNAFTLIELLVVIAVIALLATIGNAAVQTAMRGASSSAELAAAKTLATALQAAVADNNGQYPYAYDSQAKNVLDAQGKKIGMINQTGPRYPFRLAPYFGFDLEGTLLVGKNKKQILKTMKLSKPEGPMYQYAMSVFPSFGINRHFVGGVRPPQNATPSTEAVRTIAQADRNIIAFVSAGNTEVDGYEYVIAPGAPAGSWNSADWKDGADPGRYGYVHPRHNGKAVVAFLDGSVKKMTIDELRDMRLWSRNAAINDDPNYKAKN